MLVQHAPELLECGGKADTGDHKQVTSWPTATEFLQSSIFPFGVGLPDLDLRRTSRRVLLNVDIDGEMGVHVTHLVLVSLGDTGDQVVDERLDGTKGGNILPDTVVELDTDGVGALGDE